MPASRQRPSSSPNRHLCHLLPLPLAICDLVTRFACFLPSPLDHIFLPSLIPTTTALSRLDRDIWTLHSLLQLRVHEHVVLVRDLADVAARELTIEQSLDKIDAGYHSLTLTLVPVPESGYEGAWLPVGSQSHAR